MQLNYKEFGIGEPLVILHGLFGSLDNWQTLAKQFANDYRVLIVDQRNHGRSPHNTDISYPLMAMDLAGFLKDKGLAKAHILGHSMGGKTALQFAFDFPDMVHKLIVVDIVTKAYQGGHKEIFDALLAMEPLKIRSRSEADEQLKLQIKSAGVRQFLLKNLARNKDQGFRWKMNLDALYQNYPKILAEINIHKPFAGSTLFIRGGQSDYILDSDIDFVQSIMPNAIVQTVETAGHWIHADAPKELLNMVTEFLATP